MSNVVIVINGFPGVGKTSVAHELTKLLPNAKVLETQGLDAAAAAAHEPSSRANAELRKRLRETVLRSLAPPFGTSPSTNAQGRMIIITDTLYTSMPTAAYLQSYLACSRSNGINLLHVVLSCDSSTNIARLGGSSRVGKTVDEDGLVGLRMEEEIGYLIQDKTRGGTVEGLLGETEVDNSMLTAKATAGMVGQWAADALKKQGWVFPAARR